MFRDASKSFESLFVLGKTIAEETLSTTAEETPMSNALTPSPVDRATAPKEFVLVYVGAV